MDFIQLAEVEDSEAPIPQFIVKLFEMVNLSATSPVITWSASGDSFVITNKDKFAQDVLP